MNDEQIKRYRQQERAAHKLSVSVEVITPGKADDYLATMVKNRTVSVRSEDQYVRAILTNNWDPSSMIAFDEDGHLIDGQHRMLAVKKANMPATFTVLRGVPRESMFDIGRPRSVTDNLRITGIIDESFVSKNHTAVATFCIKLNKGRDGEKYSPNEIAQFISKHAETMTTAIQMCIKNGTGHPITKKAALMAAGMYALESGVDASLLSDFFKIVASGYAVKDSHDPSPAQTLRKQIQGIIGHRSFMEREQLCMAAELAINDFVLNKPRMKRYTVLKHVYFKKDEDQEAGNDKAE